VKSDFPTGSPSLTLSPSLSPPPPPHTAQSWVQASLIRRWWEDIKPLKAQLKLLIFRVLLHVWYKICSTCERKNPLQQPDWNQYKLHFIHNVAVKKFAYTMVTKNCSHRKNVYRARKECQTKPTNSDLFVSPPQVCVLHFFHSSCIQGL
jgi:hypothetical protein